MGGELLNRLEFEVAAIIDYYVYLITGSLMIVFNFVISLYFLLRISRELTIIAVFLFPMSYLVNFCARKRIKKIQQEQKEFSDRFYGFLNECLSNLKAIKAFQAEQEYKQKYCGFLSENYNLSMASISLSNLISFIRSVLNEGLNIVIIFVSALIILKDKMTIGNMVAFNTYLGKLFTAISKIMELNVQKQNILVSFERLEELRCYGYWKCFILARKVQF